MARPQFYDLTVSDVREETHDAKSVAFEVPDDLKDELAFVQGQYLTLRATINGEELRRPYSVCVAPSSGEWRVCVKRDPMGRFSGFVNDELKAGDTLGVMRKAMGRFYAPIEPEKEKSYVMMAGGSGVTPIMSNIRAVLEQEPKSKITLFYGNKTRRDIIFREAFSDLKNVHMERFRVFHVLSHEVPEVELLDGMMTPEKVTELVTKLTPPLDVDHFFICGPGPMMDGGKAALLALGVDEARIKIESFGNRPVVAKKPATKPAKDSADTANVDVIAAGVRSSLKIPFDTPSILDFALEAKIDVPYSCKSGICSTCRAKLVEGEVEMAKVHGLEPDEIEAGYILTCSSKPKSKKVVVDYDG
ncbi:1,2-phenylacetyl-CoA epoxidase, subunit E [hydrothermal vent metagenome]|uniref:1,2-phenylacetyl-CoA epoxidase, subunit E n=1 Tax=hydrothermal vent metagenome TaxID=652676 RepID=A0A3B0RV24_9ZZZZ